MKRTNREHKARRVKLESDKAVDIFAGAGAGKLMESARFAGAAQKAGKLRKRRDEMAGIGAEKANFLELSHGSRAC